MSPSEKSENFKVFSVGKIVGADVIARVLEMPDGSGIPETWEPGVGWVREGKASLGEAMRVIPVPPELAARLGIPATDLDS